MTTTIKTPIKTLFDGEFLKLLRDRHWEYVQRQHANGAAIIVAVTPRRELLLVEQHRIPLNARTIELPAGIVADSPAHAGETVEMCALRELTEETGYSGRAAQLLCSGPNAGGLTSEMVHFVRIFDLHQAHAGGGVDGEEIVVHAVPLTEMAQWLSARQQAGLLIDPKIYAALYFINAA